MSGHGCACFIVGATSLGRQVRGGASNSGWDVVFAALNSDVMSSSLWFIVDDGFKVRKFLIHKGLAVLVLESERQKRIAVRRA